MAGRAARGRGAPSTEAGRTAVGIAAVCSGLVLAALPVFLVSGLAVQIRAELDFSEAALGAAVSVAFLAGACAAPLGGRLADRIGAHRAVLAGSALSLVALVGIALAARGWVTIAVLLVVGGLGLAVTNPGLAILIARAVPASRRGLAFGMQEASIPVATLSAGLAVPAVALTLGWRWAFVLGVVPLAGVLLLLPRIGYSTADAAGGPGTAVTRRGAEASECSGAAHDGTAPPAQGRPPRAALLLMAVATAMGIGAASAVGVFLTQSAVAMGVSPGNAGLLLAVGSVAGILTRVMAGILADRHGGEQFGTISWMLAVGAATMALGASGAGPLLVVGTIGAFTGVWGWSGLLFLSMVRASPAAPGAAAGVALAGLGAGNALGPLLFGAVAQAASFRVAWLGAAAVAGLAAVLMRVVRARLLRADAAT